MSPSGRFDLHVHSVASPDGRSTVAEYVRRAAELSLAGFALTDHNSIDGLAELRRLRNDRPGLVLVPGVEVSTREGHLLLYGVDRAPPRDRPLVDVCEWATAQGGEAVVAHPYRWPHGAGRRWDGTQGPRAVETVNGHNRVRANRRAAGLARRLGLPGTGGSDAHSVRELGRAVTVVPDPPRGVDDLLEALRKGRCSADGASLSAAGWLDWGMRAGVARLARGLRSI